MALSVFAQNTAKVEEALKEHYQPQRIKEMVYKNNPLLALMPKYTQFGGKYMPVPIILTGPQRRSATFTDGLDNTSTSSVKQFDLTRARDYSFGTIEHEAIKARQSDSDAFIRFATMEIDGAIHSIKRSLAVAMYRDGSGSIGTLVGDPSGGTTMTLATDADVSNFEVGMRLSVAASSTGATVANFGGGGQNYVTVTKVDRAATSAHITVSETIHADCPSGGVLFQLGDADNTDGSKKVSGLDAWCPATAPGSSGGAPASLFGVDRSVDPVRLGGARSDGSAKPIEEALIDGLSLAAREGGSPTHIFTDFATYSNLEKALGSKVQYDKVSASDANVGFTSLKIHGPAGTVDVIADINCQPNVAWALQMDTWSLNSLDDAPHILDLDGNNMLRETRADAYETRIGYYAQIGCSAPGWNCRISL